jgi:F-type H+-transporting ATPase subunit gamma
MPSLKNLRRRIRTVQNTKLITRAMRSVSASKMRRTQERRTKAKPYVERLQALVANVVRAVGSEGQPLLEQRERQRRLLVVFSSDRGLSGAFNAVISRYTLELLQNLPPDTGVYAIGRKTGDFLRKRGYPVLKTQVDFRGNIEVHRILEIAAELRDLFLSGEYDVIELVYNRAITALTYKPVREPFLPLDPKELDRLTEKEEALDYIFEPDPATLLRELLPKFVETKILFTFVDAFAAEHQARMMAMTTANENCNELITSLTLQMNKARQAAITKEILEIVGGAEALKG